MASSLSSSSSSSRVSSLSSLSSLSSNSSFSSSSSSEIAGTFLSFTGAGITWNRSKFVASEMAAISYGFVQNRLSQSFGINTTSYLIGSISLYLRERQGLSQDYNVSVSLVETTAEGMPTGAIIAASIKPVSDITWTGWHVFPITMEEAASPASGSLSVIFQQDGGDEENYVAWSYANGDISGSKALYSSDGGTIWQEQKSVVRMIRILGIYEPFESLCNDGVIRSSIAQESVVRITNFDSPSIDGGAYYDGTHNNTMTDEMSSSSGDGAEASSDQAEGDVVVQHDKLLASIVIDTSGSMGWNDRGKNKTVAVQEIVKQLQENYPGEVLFDFVSFGGGGLGPSVPGGSSQYSAIKLDPTMPTAFVPNNDGTTPSTSDPIIACGFSNLEEGHSYIIRSVKSGETTLLDGSGLFDNALAALVAENMQSLGSRDNPILFSIAKSGPGSEISGNPTGGELSTVADVPTGGATVIRKPTTTGRHLLTSGLLSDAISGETQVVPEALDAFRVGDTVDLVDVDGVSLGHAITVKDGSSLTVSPEIAKSIETASSVSGGFVQQTSIYNSLNFDIDSMIELLVKDDQASLHRKIRFFVQTDKGGQMFWEFQAMREWVLQNITYVDEPFSLVTYIADPQGKPFPYKSRVRYYINDRPRWSEEKRKTVKIGYDPVIALKQGDDVVPVPSDEILNFHTDDEIVLISDTGKGFSGYNVIEVDDLNSSIRILPPILQDDFLLAAVEVTPPLKLTSEMELQDISFCYVDESAMTAQRQGGNRLPGDPVQVYPQNRDANFYNQKRIYWLHESSVDIPTVTHTYGNPTGIVGYAHLRILPITDDSLHTLREEEGKVARIFDKQNLSQEELSELKALNEEYDEIGEFDEFDELSSESSSNANQSKSVFEIKNDEIGGDYSLSPQESRIGEECLFSSLTSEMALNGGVFNNQLRFYMNRPALDSGGTAEGTREYGLVSKTYTVYPGLFIKNNANILTARYLLVAYPVVFTSPVQVFWMPEENKTVYFPLCCKSPGMGLYEYNDIRPGVLAASNESITIQFVVYHRGKYLKNGKMRVKFFDPFRSPIQVEVEPWKIVPDLDKELGQVPPDCMKDCADTKSFSSQSFVRRQQNDDGSYQYAIDAAIASEDAISEGQYAEATYMSGYEKGGFEIDVIHGRASLVIQEPGFITRLIVATEVVCPDNESLSCVRFDSVWFKNPIATFIDMPPFGEGGFLVPPFEAKVRVTCFGIPIPNNTVVHLVGSSHEKFGGGDVDPNSPAGQAMTQLQGQFSDIQNLGGIAGGQAAIAGMVLQSEMDNLMQRQNTWPATSVKPSIGKTINGTASGFMVGPHGPVKMHVVNNDEVGDTERFTATVSYRPPNAIGAFQYKAATIFEWINEKVKEDDPIRITEWVKGRPPSTPGATYCYTDGWDKIIFVADVPASKKGGYTFFDDPETWKTLTGYDPSHPEIPRTKPIMMNVLRSDVSALPGRDFSFYPTRPLDPDVGTPIGETDDEAYGWAAWAVSRSGFPDVPRGNCMKPCCPPCKQYEGTCRFKPSGSYFRPFWGCVAEYIEDCTTLDPLGGEVRAIPTVTWRNPLEFSMLVDGGQVERGNFDFSRDGVTSHEILAELTFSGEPLPIVARRNNVLDATGMPMPMPIVLADVYFLDQEWDEKGNLIKSKKFYDSTLSLSSYETVVHVSITTVSEKHYHHCEVDDITGNGKTTGTFLENSTVQSLDRHTHNVSSFVFQNAADSHGKVHSHNPRSVATFKLNPTKDRQHNICIDVKTSYDASRYPVSRNLSASICTKLQWFDFWELKVACPGILNMQNDNDMLNNGASVLAQLKHKINGEYVPVPDGMRIHFEMKAYSTGEDSDDVVPTFNLNSSNPGETALEQVMRSIVIIKAMFVDNTGIAYEFTKEVGLYSDLVWVPAVYPLVDYPTNDSVHIANAISKTKEVMGASALYDAIVLATDRANLYKIDNPSWANSASMVCVLTDWCENECERTINQVNSRLLMLAKDDRKPFLAVVLFGSPSNSDRFLANHVVHKASGALVHIPVGCDPTLVPDKIGSLFSMNMDTFNSGTYTGTIDIGGVSNNIQLDNTESSGIFTQTYVNVNMPTGSRMTFSARYSLDQENWSSWTEPIELSGPTPIPLGSEPCRYMQYRVKMVGNAEFESPRLSNITATYLKSSVDTIFLRPINIDASSDNFANEVVVTHAASIPENASVNYGTTCHNTTDAKDYAWSSKPWFSANERSVTLSRFNEPALRINHRTYVVLNGGWPTGASVEVYETKGNKHSGSLIKSSEYAANPKTGTIIFASPLDPESRVFVDIKPDKMIRLAIKMINGSSTPIEIKQLTLMFNRTKRVRRQSDGMIIRQTIADELESSSSSSSSSESVVPILI